MTHLSFFEDSKKSILEFKCLGNQLLKRLVLLGVLIVSCLVVQSQTLITTLSQPNIIVCDAPQELTIRVENNTALPLEVGTFSIDLDGLEYGTLVSQMGSPSAPMVSFISSPPVLFTLSGDLLVGDFVEFVISFTADVDQIAGGSYTLNTDFNHTLGSVNSSNNINVVVPASPQLQVSFAGPATINTCDVV